MLLAHRGMAVSSSSSVAGGAALQSPKALVLPAVVPCPTTLIKGVCVREEGIFVSIVQLREEEEEEGIGGNGKR